MKKVFILLVFSSFLFNEVFAQYAFEKAIGTTATEIGKTVKQTLDGGYIVGGTNLIKTDASGVVQWTKPYYADYVNITNDSGFILIYGQGIKFTKVNKNGDSLWSTYFTDGVWAREGNSIEQTSDSGFIVAGRFQSVTGSGMMLLKLNANGGTAWKQTYWESTSAAFAYGMEAHQTSDGGYVIAGYTNINYYDLDRHKDVYIVKTDSLGNAQWEKNIGGTANEYAYSVHETVGGGFILAGSQYDSSASAKNMYLIKLNALGDTVWTRTYGGAHSSEFRSVDETSDYGYIVTGHSNMSTNGGSSDIEVWKIDSNGNIQWTKSFGGADEENAHSIQQTTDGGYIITGFTESMGAGAEDAYLIKLNANGEIISPANLSENILPLNVTVYPNPSKENLFIESGVSEVTFYLFNLEGKNLLKQKLLIGINSITINHLSKGMYLYRLAHNTNSKLGKLVVE